MQDRIKVEKGDVFRIHHGRHFGRFYTVEGFGVNKWGIRHAICTYSDKPGHCELFTERDLNDFGGLFRFYDTSRRMSNAECIALAFRPAA